MWCNVFNDCYYSTTIKNNALEYQQKNLKIKQYKPISFN